MPPENSKMIALGTQMPAFRLANATGDVFDSKNTEGAKAVLLMFICNHCPFVVHVNEELGRLHEDYVQKGVSVIGINSNDSEQYPSDSFDEMRVKASEWNWKFPYLHDETQELARALNAACTPDLFLFDASQKLVYRGRLDDSRPGNGVPVTGEDIRAALDAVLSGTKPSDDQQPSIGCSIKWKN